jgi:NAD+ diphosphatase
MYSTLAGFVEPGESLEEAVAREVLEETAVIVNPAKVRYWASQPWPFPASLMLGFHAEADSEEIMVDEEELEDARWIHKSQLSHLEDFDMRLPRRDSIAYRLIVSWMNGEA